tara:strand:- start:680 stop:976 length:297 start_codon:yes stop_codon:yes gene_type:complete
MIKYVSNNIELNNHKKGNRYVYYPLRDGDSYRIVMCIEDQNGFRPVKSDLLENLSKSEAKTVAETMNFNIGMEDEHTISWIVLSTMRGRRKSSQEIGA